MSNRRSHKVVNNIIAIVLTLVIILILSAGVFIFLKLNRPEAKVAGNRPTRTSQSNGYLTASQPKVTAANPSELVADTGAAQWVKVHSKGNAAKFTDLSRDNLTIIRAHSPEVLKTASAKASTSHLMSTMIQQYPNTAIMNGSYFGGSYAEGGASSPAGLQINNGQLFNDWPQPGNGMTSQGQDSTLFGQATFVINKDGSCAAYNSSTPASQIIKNNAAMSFSFESIIVQDGKVMPSTGSIDVYRHSFIGNDKDNNIYLITCESNYGYQNLIDNIASLHLQTLVQLDSGGSSQLSLNGKVLFPSEDNRAVPDYVILK